MAFSDWAIVMMVALVFTPTRGAEQKISRQNESESYANKRKIQLGSAKKFERAGRYEDAAKLYETLGMWDKVGECRRMARTTYQISGVFHVKDSVVSMSCSHCGASTRLAGSTQTSKTATCDHCGREYVVPRKILNML